MSATRCCRAVSVQGAGPKEVYQTKPRAGHDGLATFLTPIVAQSCFNVFNVHTEIKLILILILTCETLGRHWGRLRSAGKRGTDQLFLGMGKRYMGSGQFDERRGKSGGI